MTPHITEWIHKFEVGEGARWVRAAVGLLACLTLTSVYLLFEYQNLREPAAMDLAQVARQLARGEGFTTQFIRPLSVQRLESRAEARGGDLEDPGRLTSAHPDLANPPLYPVLLAGWLRLFGADPTIQDPRRFTVHGPDRAVVIFNLGLFLALVLVTYGLACRWFDGFVGLLATVALIGSRFFWDQAGSGQPIILATLLTTLLAWAFGRYDELAREPSTSAAKLVGFAAILGGLTGLAALTCYGMILLVLPLGLLLLPIWTGRRWTAWLAAWAVLLMVVGPWYARNFHLSGHLFGTADSALLAGTLDFPGDTLERSLAAQPTLPTFAEGMTRFLSRSGQVLQQDLPTLGGSWVVAFFLVGLLFRFSTSAGNLFRGFALLSLLALFPVQVWVGPGAVGTSVFGGTSYLATVVPLLFVLGAAFFVSLLDHVDWEAEGIRGLVVGLYVAVCLVPVALMLLPPGRNPRTFPPYHPPLIHALGVWTGPRELVMSDMPWAVAWYADRKAIWLPLNAVDPLGEEDFRAVHARRHEVAGLHLTQFTTDARFASEMVQPRDVRKRVRLRAEREGNRLEVGQQNDAIGWPEFVMYSLGEGRALQGFPLLSAHAVHASAGQLLLMDRPRWNEVASGGTDEALGVEDEGDPEGGSGR